MLATNINNESNYKTEPETEGNLHTQLQRELLYSLAPHKTTYMKEIQVFRLWQCDVAAFQFRWQCNLKGLRV